MKKTRKSFNSTLRHTSDKQRAKNVHWNKITDEVCLELKMVCQYCGKKGQRTVPERLDYLDGHHLVRRRFNLHTKEVCYPCHRLPCHREIEDKNIKVQVGDYKTRELFL